MKLPVTATATASSARRQTPTPPASLSGCRRQNVTCRGWVSQQPPFWITTSQQLQVHRFSPLHHAQQLLAGWLHGTRCLQGITVRCTLQTNPPHHLVGVLRHLAWPSLLCGCGQAMSLGLSSNVAATCVLGWAAQPLLSASGKQFAFIMWRAGPYSAPAPPSAGHSSCMPLATSRHVVSQHVCCITQLVGIWPHPHCRAQQPKCLPIDVMVCAQSCHAWYHWFRFLLMMSCCKRLCCAAAVAAAQDGHSGPLLGWFLLCNISCLFDLDWRTTLVVCLRKHLAKQEWAGGSPLYSCTCRQHLAGCSVCPPCREWSLLLECEVATLPMKIWALCSCRPVQSRVHTAC